MSTDALVDSKPEGEVVKEGEDLEDSDNNMQVTSASAKCCSCCWGGNKRAYVTVFVLFVINLLNYMDRQTIAGRENNLNRERFHLSSALYHPHNEKDKLSQKKILSNVRGEAYTEKP